MDSVSGVSSLLETSRDLTLDAVQAAAARTFGGRGTKDELSVNQIKKLLDSRFDQEVLDGMRKVINMMYRGQPCLPFFSNIIKQVASPNIEIKKLVYIYLLQHAEQEPDLALLSINTIQKALSDQSPQVRAMALRVMSGIRVPIISQIVSLAIKKGCGDMSALVRKTAAAAIPKCYRLEPSTEPQLVDYISQLLGDKQYYVVGAAVVAFIDVCPDRTDLLHKHYRSLVRKLVDMEEWGQVALLRVLTAYARQCFLKPSNPSPREDGSREEDETSRDRKDQSSDLGLDPDLALLLNACKNLLSSRNPAVVLAVARTYLYIGTREYLETAIRPTIGLLRGTAEQQAIVLYDIVSICLDHPAFFAPYVDRFWVKATDPQDVWRLKVEILTLIFPQSGSSVKGLILNELEHFTTTSDTELTRESVRAMGRCAQGDSSTAQWCINLLLNQASSPDDNLVGEALTVVRHLIQQDPARHRTTIIRLAKNLDNIYNAQARATIVWLIGEYATIGAEGETIAPDVLRILCRGFAQEEELVKSQVLLLGAKVYLNHLNNVTPSENAPGKGDSEDVKDEEEEQKDREAEESAPAEAGPKGADPEHIIAKIWDYILLLVRYDTSFELRDRARLYKNLLADVATLPLANLILLAPKPVPQVSSPSETRKNLLLGSTTLIVGQDAGPSGLAGYETLPDWVQPGNEPDPSLRDTGSGLDPSSGRTPAAALLESVVSEKAPVARPKVAQKSLNDWLDEEDGGGEAVIGSGAGVGQESGDDDEDEEDESGSDDSDEDESEQDESEESSD